MSGWCRGCERWGRRQSMQYPSYPIRRELCQELGTSRCICPPSWLIFHPNIEDRVFQPTASHCWSTEGPAGGWFPGWSESEDVLVHHLRSILPISRISLTVRIPSSSERHTNWQFNARPYPIIIYVSRLSPRRFGRSSVSTDNLFKAGDMDISERCVWPWRPKDESQITKWLISLRRLWIVKRLDLSAQLAPSSGFVERCQSYFACPTFQTAVTSRFCSAKCFHITQGLALNHQRLFLICTDGMPYAQPRQTRTRWWLGFGPEHPCRLPTVWTQTDRIIIVFHNSLDRLLPVTLILYLGEAIANRGRSQKIPNFHFPPPSVFFLSAVDLASILPYKSRCRLQLPLLFHSISTPVSMARTALFSLVSSYPQCQYYFSGRLVMHIWLMFIVSNNSLYGITNLQIFLYFHFYKNDRIWSKLIVGISLIICLQADVLCDLGHLVMVSHLP